MFRKILIANRGEIAVRVIRACRELGIRAVAVYSEADASALHVRLADEAIPIGPAPATESYLSIPRLLEAAARTKSEAIHPGYGFLSEDADFAQAVQQAGLAFIGPSPAAMRAMGDKAAARDRMQAAGVPVVPGYQGPDDDGNLARAAGQIGYPVMVKAAAGGGGRGMRVVWEAGQLGESLASARHEARQAFGDGRLILEKYIPFAHHIEFQVFGDPHGQVIHLFERECSVQRRHQKIIEESPSPLLDDDLRWRMGATAVQAAQAAGYTNAGTIEFIVNPQTRQYYFLEMNTRLQVEHPVTELVTGLDLVHWQLRVAAGEPLPFTQDELSQRGHAIECRLYAEDAANRFLPATGRLLRFIEPKGPGVRLDSGFTSGDEITIHYDPLIAKLICTAEDRPSAIRRMQSALRQTAILGITTNWQFLQDVLATSEFEAGSVYTTWVDERFANWQPPECVLPVEVLIAAALTQHRAGTPPPEKPGAEALPAFGNDRSESRRDDPFSPWQVPNAFRVGG
jgi:acetyl-CoA carboxylase biotin carboxylase subunit